MGKSESGEGRLHRREAGQEHYIGCWQKENRSRAAGTVGEGEGGEEGGLAVWGACFGDRVGLWVWVLGAG